MQKIFNLENRKEDQVLWEEAKGWSIQTNFDQIY